MQPSRRKFESVCQKCSLWDYLTLVVYEKECSERHNRYFAIVGLIVISLPGEDQVGQLKKQLRTSDYVFLVPDPTQSLQIQWKIGLLLPGTDQEGAAVVRNRLRDLYIAQRVQFQMGLAIYPDDGTTPEKLLTMAFETDLQTQSFQ